MPQQGQHKNWEEQQNNLCHEKTAFSLCFMVYFVNLNSKQKNCAIFMQNSTNFIITITLLLLHELQNIPRMNQDRSGYNSIQHSAPYFIKTHDHRGSQVIKYILITA